jgi:diaminopimelate decarboxylase
MNELLAAIARDHGTPCFVYFMDQVYDRVRSIREAFGGRLGVSYAMKCNPHPEILKRMKERVETLDISSGGELKAALRVGWPADRISFTGPAKLPGDLEAAAAHGIGDVILESVREARLLSEAAGRAGRSQRVLVRVAPKKVPKGFGVNMAGKPCQFGIDEEDLDPALDEIKALPHLRLSGFHIYSGTQCLKPDALAENYEIFLDIFQRFAASHEVTPEKLILGSGIGIPYHDGDKSVDLAPVAERVNPLLDALKGQPRFARAALLLETGRYLIGEAGVYMTRVVSRKQSRGAQIATCDGGMNHHLGACGHLGMVLHRNYQMFKVSPVRPDAAEQAYDLFGPLCTTIDTLGRGVKFPGLEVGDVIGVRCSGAYGVTASPLNFISHPPPGEVLVETRDGRAVVEDVSASRASVLQLL